LVVPGVVEVVRDRYAGGLELAFAGFAGHVFDLHLSAPLRIAQRLGDAPWREVAELPGTFGAIYPAGMPFKLRTSDASEDVTVMLDPAFLSRTASEAGLGGDGVELRGDLAVADERMALLVRALAGELEAAAPGGMLVADSLAAALAVHLVREHSGIGYRGWQALSREAARVLPERVVRQVGEYVEANLGADLRLAELAAVAHLSPHHFARSFRAATGLSPHQFVLARRVQRADELLRTTDRTVLDIAVEVGFSSHSHLTAQFRARLGVTPAQRRTAAS
jgi:AraC family transcriptional regulator